MPPPDPREPTITSTSARLGSLELAGGDLAATKRFYSTVFGWTWTDYGPTYAAADLGGLEFALAADSPACTQHVPGSQSAAGTLVLLETDDLDAAHQHVRDAGGEIITETFDFPGGSRFHLRDPAGNVVGVYRTDPAA